MVVFDKSEIREKLTTDNIYDLLLEWGGDPEYNETGIVSSTICHNMPGEGSKKLYYYENTGLFKCYTGCDATFDVFELCTKVMRIQHEREFDLNSAILWVAHRFGLGGTIQELDEAKTLEDWKIFNEYSRIQNIEKKTNQITLKTYDEEILTRFNYKIQLTPWLDEGISQEALNVAKIGFYPGGDQITIPHYDINGRFIGLRGRSLCKDECELYGKYRPIHLNNQWYSHPLGMNLYNLNLSKNAIKTFKKAIVFEGEKSVLKYKTYFGLNNDISVACCGSNLSSHQVQLLLDCGVEEIIIAFDRQFKELGDDEFKHLKLNLLKARSKFKNYATISFMFDKTGLLGYKDSPIDDGKDIFLKLFKERIII